MRRSRLCFLLLLSWLVPAYADMTEKVVVEFSHESGVYEEGFFLKLQTNKSDTDIYYTLDGSEPDPANIEGKVYRYKNSYLGLNEEAISQAENGFVKQEYKTYKYVQPISVKNKAMEPDRVSQISTTFDLKPEYFPEPVKVAVESWINFPVRLANHGVDFINLFINKLRVLWYQQFKNRMVYEKIFVERFAPWKYKLEYTRKGTVVRAVALARDGSKSKINTRTFLVGEHRDYKLPLLFLTIPEHKLFDYDQGMLVAGVDYDDGLKNGADNSTEKKFANWERRGKRGQVKGNVEIISGFDTYNQNIKIRVHGNYSRRSPNKSFRFYAGKKGFNYSFFEDDDNFKYARINLRNGGGAHDLVRDAALQKVVYGTNVGVQRFKPVAVFLNSEFYGVYNLRDRKDQKYIQQVYRLPDDNVNLLENNASAEAGSNVEYLRLLQEIFDFSGGSEEFYEFVTEYIDLESLIDYFASSIYFARIDWPSNNIAYWQYRGVKEPGAAIADGRWRWLFYDVDSAYERTLIDHDTLRYAVGELKNLENAAEWSTSLLKTLLENDRVKQEFVVRFSDMLNTYFREERAAQIIKNASEAISYAMPYHIQRWKEPRDLGRWEKNIDEMILFANQRPTHQRQHLNDFFELEGLYEIKVNVNAKEAGTVKVNTLHLGLLDHEIEKPLAASVKAVEMDKVLAFPWRGLYFKNLPLELEAVPKLGYRFSHWKVKGIELTGDQMKSSKLILFPQDGLEFLAVYNVF